LLCPWQPLSLCLWLCQWQHLWLCLLWRPRWRSRSLQQPQLHRLLQQQWQQSRSRNQLQLCLPRLLVRLRQRRQQQHHSNHQLQLYSGLPRCLLLHPLQQWLPCHRTCGGCMRLHQWLRLWLRQSSHLPKQQGQQQQQQLPLALLWVQLVL
jgi:hypothetical protein